MKALPWQEHLNFKRMIAVIAAGITLLVLTGCARQDSSSAQLAAQAALIESLRADVADLKARQQIHEVYLRYMRGFDRNDVELMRSAFWPEVQINYGKQSNTFDEFVLRHLQQHLDTLQTWMHHLTNETVEIKGDVAHVESYVTRLASRKKDNRSMINSGRYIDRLERRNGEWRIVMREFVPTFVTDTQSSLQTYMPDAATWSPSACSMGTWDKHDPSYLRPLNRRAQKEVGPACAE